MINSYKREYLILTVNFQISILQGKDINSCEMKELKFAILTDAVVAVVKETECFKEKSTRNTVARTTVKIQKIESTPRGNGN